MKPLSPEHNALVRNHLAEHGIELTIEELIRVRKKAYQTVRENMRAKGYALSDSDEELYYLLKNAGLDIVLD